MSAKLDHEVADLKRRLDEALAERDAAEARQAAMAEILEIINSSPGDLAPVFDAMLEKATRLCDAEFGTLWTYDGKRLHPAGLYRVPAGFAEFLREPIGADESAVYAAIVGGQGFVHVPDLADSDPYREGQPLRRATVDLGGARTGLAVAIRKDKTLLGIFAVYRQEVRPFSHKQIALLQNFATQAVVAMGNARLLTETREALEQQTAAAEVLQVINSSPGDLMPIFEAMVHKAIRLCDAASGTLWTYDGQRFAPAAVSGASRLAELFEQHDPSRASPDTPGGQLLAGERIVHILDVKEDPAYRAHPRFREMADIENCRTFVAVGLRKENVLLGMITVYREEVRPFSGKQIGFLQNFAEQAVIAIENARLINETREALDQQTATAEVLQVINSSPGNLGPVFDAMLEKATRLCAASFGILLNYDGQRFRHASLRGIPPAYAKFMQEHPPVYGPDSAPGRLLGGEDLVHVLDMMDTDLYRSGEPNRLAIADLAGARTVVAVPLRKDDVLMGAIVVFRQEIRAFSEKQLSLLRNFAAQAVIAMENARLITETREALEQQTATAEVLGVINSSPGDLKPVFDAILEKAHTLCGAEFGSLQVYDGREVRAVAARGLPEAFVDRLRLGFHPEPNHPVHALSRGDRIVQLDMIELDKAIGRAAFELGGMRTVLFVPLRKDAALLGYITAARPEVRAFSEKEIGLLENFAAQAVIAMENARLITETREALEQQTATAEVLGVINSSPGDLAPVFDAMLEKALVLCDAAFGAVRTFDGELFHLVAMQGNDPDAVEKVRERGPVRPSGTFGLIARGDRVVHAADVRELEDYRIDPAARERIELHHIRSWLAIGLQKEGMVLGALMVWRQDVRPFSDKEIAVLENFAAQAVIAMENARLIIETREALEQQTATADVLSIINSSPGDLSPVFAAMLDKATTLCEATFGILWVREGEEFHAAALRGVPVAYAEVARQPQRPRPDNPLGRMLRGERLIISADVAAEDLYRQGDPVRRALVDLGGAHSAVQVALVKDDALLGSLTVFRQEVRPFSEKQIALLENFAAQAVIAMENARLITETREALEQQTATAEVLQVINSSPGDLTPVFDAMLEKATGLCEAPLGTLWLYDGQHLNPVATRGASPKFADFLRRGPHKPNPVQERQLRGEGTIHLADLKGTVLYRDGDTLARASADLGGIQAVLSVPLRREDRVLGLFGVYRLEQRPFSEKQIALVENFAAQAVIAIENARLVNETREALEQQTATAEVLGVINSSPGDLAPVFDAMLDKAMRLCEAAFGQVFGFNGKQFDLLAVTAPAEFAAAVRGYPSFRAPPGSALDRLVQGSKVVHIPDVAADPAFAPGSHERARILVDIGKCRSLLTVGLRRDDALVGAISVYRQDVRPFTDKQIALLENFAAQAVIAMENARLITETREALEQQTATAEVLGVINSSPGDLSPVFDTMLERAMTLCGAAFGELQTYDGESFSLAAMRGIPEAYAEFRKSRTHVYGPGTVPAKFLAGEGVQHILDVSDSEAYRNGETNRRALVDLGGARTVLAVPLRKEGGALLGFINAYRQEVRSYSDSQVALLENFAAQAVIAIENARLLDEIRQRQAELRVTFDNMADGVAMFDEELRLAAWNRNFQQIAELPEALLNQRPRYADYLRILTERGELDTLTLDEELNRRLEHTDQEISLERTRPNGRVIEVRRNAVPGGGFVLIYSDITERKRSEAEIRAARDAAETAYHELKTTQASLMQAQKMAALGQLTAGIAHEIKNPLNFVNNFAGLSVELLDELKESAAPAIGTLDEDTRAEINDTMEMLTGNLEKIVEHGQRADGIVKSMLEHSRGVTSERRRVDLNNLVEEALNLAYHGARAQDQNFNIILERNYEKGLAEIEIVPQEVNRVFINLIGNGFYAASKRQRESGEANFRPILKVETRDLGEAIEVRIRDNGIGIPPEIKDKLFQPFFTTKPTGEGTGLGLSISYDIVTQQHGGTIEVESEVGGFTEFTVRIPRSYRATAEAAS